MKRTSFNQSDKKLPKFFKMVWENKIHGKWRVKYHEEYLRLFKSDPVEQSEKRGILSKQTGWLRLGSGEARTLAHCCASFINLFDNGFGADYNE